MEEVKQVVNEIITNVENEKLKKENEKLKKENEYLTIKLKNEVAMWKKQWEEMRDQENETCKAFREEKADRRKAEKENEKLKEERDSFKIAMIKHTTENYDKWRKEQESVAIGLMKVDLEKAQKEKEEIEGCLEATITERDKAFDDINKLKDGNKQLNDVYEELKNDESDDE